MDLESKNLLMEIDMWVNGSKALNMDKELISPHSEWKHMKVGINMVNVQEKESYYISLEIVLREVGTMT